MISLKIASLLFEVENEATVTAGAIWVNRLLNATAVFDYVLLRSDANIYTLDYKDLIFFFYNLFFIIIISH